MYMLAMGNDFASFYSFSTDFGTVPKVWYFGTVPKVWYFSFFILLQFEMLLFLAIVVVVVVIV